MSKDNKPKEVINAETAILAIMSNAAYAGHKKGGE